MAEFPAARLTQAVERQSAGDLAGAQALYWQILLDDPRQFDALNLLGVTKCQQGQHTEGCWFIARALEQRPDDAGANFNLGTALAELHREAEAVACFDRALAARPEHAQTWCSRGNALFGLRRYADAIESYRRALAINPRLSAALSNLGSTLISTGQPAAAIDLCRQAIAEGADGTTCLINIGRAHQELGQIEAACQAFDDACAGAPDDARPRWFRAIAALPNVAASESEIEASRGELSARLDDLAAWYDADPNQRYSRLEQEWPFYLAYQARNNRALMAKYGGLRAQLMAQWQQRQNLPPVSSNRSGPVRVGIVSSHLENHSVWHAITRGWFAHLDPARIALHAFHLGGGHDSDTKFAQARAASFTLGARPLEAWVRAIQAVRPDVLIYPEIGMHAATANLASLRLAPVQLTTWGHPETSGLPTIDGYISADAFEPAGAAAHYTERLIRLPRFGAAYVPRAVVPAVPDLAALGIDPARPILIAPGSPFKYAPGNDGALAAIARRTGNGQLIFFHPKSKSPMSARLEQRLAARFAAEGLDFAAQVRFIPFQRGAAFHGLLQRAEVCLDTIGFSGFNTAMQALGNFTPMAAFEGAFMRGRLASGILRVMGLDELVATTEPEFVDIASRLATDAAWRATMQDRIRVSIGAVYDDRAAVLALQDELERLAGPLPA